MLHVVCGVNDGKSVTVSSVRDFHDLEASRRLPLAEIMHVRCPVLHLSHVAVTHLSLLSLYPPLSLCLPLPLSFSLVRKTRRRASP